MMAITITTRPSLRTSLPGVTGSRRRLLWGGVGYPEAVDALRLRCSSKRSSSGARPGNSRARYLRSRGASCASA